MTNGELKKIIVEIYKNVPTEIVRIENVADVSPVLIKRPIPELLAETLIDAGLIFKKDYRKSRSAELARQERFAEEQGFTPDCSPYYIALQYKKRAETIREETAHEIFAWFWHNLVNLNFITGNIEVNFAALQNLSKKPNS